MHVLKMPEKFDRSSKSSEVINDLLFQLDSEGVNYCQFKSNWKIDQWLEGEGDLDLLVKRRDIGKFSAILFELGFKKAVTLPEMEIPGIFNFYAFDSGLQKFIHVHAHYQLVFGHDLTKNYHLPIEDAYLNSAIRSGEINIAAPEMEMILFALRMVLKFSAFETIGRHATGKAKKHFNEIYEELNYLKTEADDLKLRTALKQHFPMISWQLFSNCLDSLKPGATILQRIIVRQRLEKELAVYGRSSRWSEKLTRIIRWFSYMFRRFIIRKKALKKFENGGSLIAIIGGDGAGKTTCVNEIYGWLSKKFETKRFHLGKPPKSFITLLIAGLLKIKNKFDTLINDSETETKAGLLQNLRWICTARDRFRLYQKIRRLASNGTIVICDRYPVSNISLMDSPKISIKSDDNKSLKGIHILSRLENYYYQQILSPDHMFVLRVEPYIAVVRKTDESRTHVFTRSTELWNINWRGEQARLIDAGRELPEVLNDLRQSIWKIL